MSKPKIAVTGAGGFIGSHVTELLLKSGYPVRALAHYRGGQSPTFLDQLAKQAHASLEIRAGDITDPFFVRDFVSGCDIVLHLAALIAIPYSYVAPASYVAVNVTGTTNVLEACRAASVKRVVVTSTSEVYGTARYTPIDEQHPLQAQSPYSASKIAAEKMAEAYFRSFNLPVVILRPFNTYGPRQSPRAFVPSVLMQALSGRNSIEVGNLEPKRDLTYVDDTARAFLFAATTPGIEGETIHVGQGSTISMRDLAALCLKTAGSKAKIKTVTERVRPAKSEVDLLLCNPGKAEKLLGWKTEISLGEGIRRTCDYLREHSHELSNSSQIL